MKKAMGENSIVKCLRDIINILKPLEFDGTIDIKLIKNKLSNFVNENEKSLEENSLRTLLDSGEYDYPLYLLLEDIKIKLLYIEYLAVRSRPISNEDLDIILQETELDEVGENVSDLMPLFLISNYVFRFYLSDNETLAESIAASIFDKTGLVNSFDSFIFEIGQDYLGYDEFTYLYRKSLYSILKDMFLNTGSKNEDLLIPTRLGSPLINRLFLSEGKIPRKIEVGGREDDENRYDPKLINLERAGRAFSNFCSPSLLYYFEVENRELKSFIIEYNKYEAASIIGAKSNFKSRKNAYLFFLFALDAFVHYQGVLDGKRLLEASMNSSNYQAIDIKDMSRLRSYAEPILKKIYKNAEISVLERADELDGKCPKFLVKIPSVVYQIKPI